MFIKYVLFFNMKSKLANAKSLARINDKNYSLTAYLSSQFISVHIQKNHFPLWACMDILHLAKLRFWRVLLILLSGLVQECGLQVHNWNKYFRYLSLLVWNLIYELLTVSKLLVFEVRSERLMHFWDTKLLYSFCK